MPQWLAQLGLVLKSTQVLVTRSELPMFALLAKHDKLSLNIDDVITIDTHHRCRTIHSRIDVSIFRFFLNTPRNNDDEAWRKRGVEEETVEFRQHLDTS